MRLVNYAIVCIMLSGMAFFGQQTPPPTPNDTLKSVRLLPDNKVQFSIYAPEASQVTCIVPGDIPAAGFFKPMEKSADGVWKVTIQPVMPGAFRYQFNVDGVATLDPLNTETSESSANVVSLFYEPGETFMDTREVPHGAVAEVTYYSNSLKKFRRMHIYTPPGYEQGKGKYPVFYLLHGGGDSDDSWSTVGRAGFIFDNLLSEGKMKPMVVVMPNGHVNPWRWGQPLGEDQRDLFIEDFLNDIMPYIENHYRTKAGKQNRALAGLSMGGGQTLNMVERFSYVGVFSSGIFGIVPMPGMEVQSPTWEELNQEKLKDPQLKKEVKLIWFATGREDFLIETSRATVDLIRKYGFDVQFKETDGGHTWINWRQYLNEFAPLLFQ
jgi:enterochelin esterase-like enzyme